MGFFGKLFEKKVCDLCGGEIGLLGNRKLEDGNLCKTCAKKLSPWFEDRRHSTVEEIRAQLQYREENQTRVNQFTPTRIFGENTRVLLDETHGWLTVSRLHHVDSMQEENPDVLDFSAITGCRMDIRESRRELTQEDAEGKQVSYNPPRHEYSYDFYMIITVNNPYFDEMRFRLNSSTVEFEDGPNMGGRKTGGVLGFGTRSLFDPMNNPDYRYFYNLSEEICQCVRDVQASVRSTPAQAPHQSVPAEPVPAPAPASGPWTCTACGAENNGKFCEFCGTPRP